MLYNYETRAVNYRVTRRYVKHNVYRGIRNIL